MQFSESEEDERDGEGTGPSLVSESEDDSDGEGIAPSLASGSDDESGDDESDDCEEEEEEEEEEESDPRVCDVVKKHNATKAAAQAKRIAARTGPPRSRSERRRPDSVLLEAATPPEAVIARLSSLRGCKCGIAECEGAVFTPDDLAVFAAQRYCPGATATSGCQRFRSENWNLVTFAFFSWLITVGIFDHVQLRRLQPGCVYVS